MPATLDHDLESLAPPGNPDDFVVLEDRPVWKEHWTRESRDDDDNLLAESVFMGREELEKVAENCNKRITETGDFAPFVIGHTKDDGSETPEVIGFVGPYYVGEVGKSKPKAAIYAKKIWVFKEHYHRLKQLPRLSVEYWSDDDDPTNGFFDPISALGATTPELDLGIRYQRNEAGQRLMRYAKLERFNATAAPGGSNTFLPSTDGKTKHNYELGGTMAGPTLTPEDLSMIVSALVPICEAKIEEAMSAMKPQQEPVVDGAAVPQEPVAPPGEMPPGMEGEPPVEGEMPPEPGEAVPGDEPPGDDMPPDDEPAPDEEPPMADDAPEKVKAKAAKYQKERDETVRKYQREVAEHRQTKANYEKLKTEVDGYRADKRKAERYAKLSALANEGAVFDLDEELSDTETLNDDQFEKHCDRIVNKYARVPIGRSLPQEKTPKKSSTPTNERRERYAKQAAENVAAARKEGKSLDFDREVARLHKEDTAA